MFFLLGVSETFFLHLSADPVSTVLIECLLLLFGDPSEAGRLYQARNIIVYFGVSFLFFFKFNLNLRSRVRLPPFVFRFSPFSG